MNIIRRILNIFKPKEVEQDSEFDWNHTDNEYKVVLKNYERNLRELKKQEAYNERHPELISRCDPKHDYKIRFEFIPEQQNFKNVRSALQFIHDTYKPWTSIRNMIEANNGGICCICSKTSQDFKEASTNTECHEVWKFQNKNGRNIQSLVRLEPLCVCCHEIKHINRFNSQPDYQAVLLQRYAELNNITYEKAQQDLEDSKEWKLSKKSDKYLLDMSMLNNLDTEFKFNELFDCHEPQFLQFLEEKFKSSKSNEPE